MKTHYLNILKKIAFFSRRFIVLVAYASACFLALPAVAQKVQPRFSHLNTFMGLSQSNVFCIMQDSKGFMWFGTADGLNRYDGYDFQVFKHSALDPSSIGNNYITGITEDDQSNIWITTWGNGLDMYDRMNDKFVHYPQEDGKNGSVTRNFLTGLLKDGLGNLWIGTASNGLQKFDLINKKFEAFSISENKYPEIKNAEIKCLVEDSRGDIWIGTEEDGLYQFSPASGALAHYHYQANDTTSLSQDNVYSVMEDSKHRIWIGANDGGLNLFDRTTGNFHHFKKEDHLQKNLQAYKVNVLMEGLGGRIWIGTENGGINIFDPLTKAFQNLSHDELDNTSISNNSIYALVKDVKGNIWVGTFAGGVDFFNHDARYFEWFKHNSSPASLSDNHVLSIFEDHAKNMWIGTDGGGLNLFNRQKGTFKHFMHDANDPRSLCGNYVLHVMEDSKNDLWIGTWGDGISVYDHVTHNFRNYRNDPEDTTSLASDYIWTICRDDEGRMWIGTYGGGLDLFDPVHGTFSHHQTSENDSTAIDNNKVYVIRDDGIGKLWIGTDGGGLNVLDKKTGKLSHYIHHANDSTSISNNRVISIYKDALGNFWIGTMGGLNHLDTKTGKFKVYTVRDGLPNDMIYGILSDKKRNLWISTNNGLVKFNPFTGKVLTYNVSDGLASSEFKEMAFCKSSSGEMYFGGNNGFNLFNPDSIRPLPFEPPLVLTAFRLFNKSITVSRDAKEDAPLKKNITETDQITLPYNNGGISFDFATLNYVALAKKQYAYKLEGFDKDWNDIGSKRTANYTNLDPGSYVLRVRGLDNEGKWSAREIKVRLHILPPIWLTWWFKLSAGLLSFCIVAGFYRYRTNEVRKLNYKLEKQVRDRTEMLRLSNDMEKKARQEAEEANKSKSVFLATMSHEIRTPMNGVIGMASLLDETPLNEEQKTYTQTIRNCSETLLNVINDILDFSKIESGKMEIDHKNFGLRTCVEDMMDVFAARIAEKDIDLVFQMHPTVPEQVVGDGLRLRQVLMNLISNALKFTDRGEIFIGVDLIRRIPANKLEIGISVRDTGIGIPADKMDRLFKSFSQVDSSSNRRFGGTGLGLVISEKLVKLMGGAFTVTSELDKGTTFQFSIIVEQGKLKERTGYGSQDVLPEGRKVLIVDDNYTNLTILKAQLEQWNQLAIPVDSAEKALLLLEKDPNFDLILSDMHMPGMDGLEFAKIVREKYAGISLVLLSSAGDDLARKNSDYFDAILVKPVRQELLYKVVKLKLQPSEPPASLGSSNQVLDAGFSAKYPLRILIAEDNPINQMLAVKVLEKLGYNPLVTTNGEEAVEACIQENFDVILMDVQMPVMDGLEATRIIRRQVHHQPAIIAITANAMEADRQICLEAGMNDYISKPLNFETLIDQLKKWAVSIARQQRG